MSEKNQNVWKSEVTADDLEHVAGGLETVDASDLPPGYTGKPDQS